MFDHLIGNAPIQRYLTKALISNTLPHGLLFSGPAGVGKTLFAEQLARALLNGKTPSSHPDYHEIHPESKSGLHSIDSLRLLIEEVHRVSFNGEGKVFVIFDAHKMQTASANALLKTFEEPTPRTTFILLTEYSGEILPTIRSRLTHLEFKPIPEKDIEKFLVTIGLNPSLAKLSQGSIGKAIQGSKRIGKEKEIFSLLSQTRSYSELLVVIEKLEKEVENEDPVQTRRNIDALFEAVLIWYRDQHAMASGAERECLFFQSEEPINRALPKLEKVLSLIQIAREGVQRNIKLSTCFDLLFRSLHKTG